MNSRKRKSDQHRKQAQMNNQVKEKYPPTIYPTHPQGSDRLVRINETDLNLLDRISVTATSLLIFGSVAWVPALFVWAWKRWRKLQKESEDLSTVDYVNEKEKEQFFRRRKKVAAVYAAILFVCTALVVGGPHRSKRLGKLLKFKDWPFLTSWMKFVALEIIEDRNGSKIQLSPTSQTRHRKDIQASGKEINFYDQAVLAVAPHGIIPFSVGFAVIPRIAERILGYARPVVATATKIFPFVNIILGWSEKVDASRPSVDKALRQGDRLCVNPGGIDEIFLGYPQPGTNPNTEYCIVRRGFLRLALKHGVPVFPIYCFGATKMFRRLELPFLERLSHWLRVSLVLFYGVAGLPIPFRQKLLYVIGNPIVPPTTGGNNQNETQIVDEMHKKFCTEMSRLFERHKDAYGWGHKTLEILSR